MPRRPARRDGTPNLGHRTGRCCLNFPWTSCDFLLPKGPSECLYSLTTDPGRWQAHGCRSLEGTMRRSTATVLCLMALGVTLHGLAATVTSTADSGSGSLRDAIASAAAGDTIGFSVTGTITLTSGELLIVKNLTISGPGAASLAVQRSSASATPMFRIFDVQGGVVSISGLTISNGSDTTGGGGGLNNQATCTVRDCIITGNSASGSGGGVNNLSTLSLSNCVVRGNSVAASSSDAQGGGIFSDGTLTVINCTVSGNSALGGSVVSGFGGGINNQGTLTLTNSVISGNAAGGGAGAEGGGI